MARYEYQQKEITDIERQISKIDKEVAVNEKMSVKATIDTAIALFSRNNSLLIKRKSLENRLRMLTNPDYRSRISQAYDQEFKLIAKIPAI